MPRTVAIIQARMSSTRLPGKVLLDLGGLPMLAWVVERARQAAVLDEVWVAATTDPADDPIAGLCAARGYAWMRGHPLDVLDRYYQAAQASRAQVIVRLTADCPLIDPGLIDRTVGCFLGLEAVPGKVQGGEGEFPWDFAANRLPPPWGRTYPIGLDVEVCSFAALERAWREAASPHQREHVMPYLYEGSPVIDSRNGLPLRLPPGAVSAGLAPAFRVLLINHSQDYGSLRWTVDTPQDLEMARRLLALFPGRDDFTWLEALAQFQAHPELQAINAAVQHKSLYDVDERLAPGS
jgi:spore coat polysaccharide biosynthesis protein SpsF